MIPIYRHTQIGWTILAMLAGALALVIVVSLPAQAPTIVLITLAVLTLAALLFGSLTVSVDDTAVRWHFGPGVWHKSLPLAEVADLCVIRTRWWYGWGIRISPHGWLYNVSGLGAVAITRTDGRQVWLGSDEPERLAEAIEQARSLREWGRREGVRDER